MSEFKGTKGKWYRNTESRIVSSVYSENKESLIHISGKCTEEKQANAQLISCAPEMLEMLEKVVFIKDDSDLDFTTDSIKQLIKKATTI